MALHSWSGPQLPPEMYLKIFRCLTHEEKGSVRSTCRLFKQLIDQPACWRDTTVILKGSVAYSPGFWEMLKKRRTCSVLVRKARANHLRKLLWSLPSLRALAIDPISDAGILDLLTEFRNVEKLVLKVDLNTPAKLFIVHHLNHLTHLTVCDLKRHCRENQLLRGVSALTNLRSLTLHCDWGDPAVKLFRFVLFQLPSLRELSVKVNPFYTALQPDSFSPLTGEQCNRIGLPHSCVSRLQLEKLELLDCEDIDLCEESLNQLSSLRRLFVHFTCGERARHFSIDLDSVLRKLPHLTELRQKRGRLICKALPAHLESLSLNSVFMNPTVLKRLASAELKHLRLDHCTSNIESLNDFPQLFPHLKTLSIRCFHMTGKEFVHLAKLRYLEKLDIVDVSSIPSITRQQLEELIRGFRITMDNRVQIVQHPEPQERAACDCSAH
ncbi:uncharacterized protein LOC117422017 isoform X1 [Acipenser ruthenus]|uniref:uncharacterized protein LOC117422017 isoform X1 n=1 Tax=Acipenser ruthenus TaxID=7906 RepID=UPI0027410072|nr:uncharacterized protein LOC117422017 isoform X1 [Acipenser ruthenus]